MKLYSRGLSLKADLIEHVVKRTEHASPAFIKELMRRTAQHYLQSGGKSGVRTEDINLALEDMLFSGGTLNVKLLGGALAKAQA